MMTTTKTVEISCDGCGRSIPYKFRSVSEAVGAARGAGWHKQPPNRDICPSCWEVHRREVERLADQGPVDSTEEET